ncbi:hypothetical protein L210DRAFT_3634446 [Boletus edulis BED1]|uniref:Uncharacterized protein n=1 Tax=Boletus edulis BED1 TaxID=1328754 RepID=A0AAD4G8C7_BOLED|nr:hypothetical protein L210DRAFT_3634446 [Boletus edulis BED1]
MVFILKLLRTILGLTLYDMMQLSHDFEDVKAALNDRIDWSVELFRSCLTIRIDNGSYFFMCALAFLVIAENIHLHYGRLSPTELKERADQIGYATFAILFAVLDIGFVIVRVAGFVALSGSPALAVGLVFVTMSPFAILPVLTYPARLLKRRKQELTEEAKLESGTMVDGIQT